MTGPPHVAKVASHSIGNLGNIASAERSNR